MSAHGDCFVVQAPNCIDKTIIVGRNSQDAAAVGIAQEVLYFAANAVLEGKNDGGVELKLSGDSLRMILQKPRPGVWGGDCGANERNVSIAITWSANEPAIDGGHLLSTDILRHVLAKATSAAEAVQDIGNLVEEHGSQEAKFNFLVCDPTEVWQVSCAGKLMAAQRMTAGHLRVPCDGLAVNGGEFDKSTIDLRDKLAAMGKHEAGFAEAFGSVSSAGNWCGPEPTGDSSYSLTSMFETLRAAAKADVSRSASVFVLNGAGISCYWFTGTPNAMESVFKPFVFSPHAKISPLTKVQDAETTLLHKLHAQRKPAAVENLKALEGSCVAEVAKYLNEHPVADEELDELMKDCVEAEVKFYR